MKKLILMLLVLVGGVIQANAWGDMYLLCYENDNWGYTNSDDFKFSKIDDNNFKITIPASYVNNTSGDYWYFRFREKDSNTWNNIGPGNINLDITNNANYVSANGNSSYAFEIQKGSAKADVQIFITWLDSKWHVSAITEGTTTISFEKPTGWNAPKAYMYLKSNNAEVHYLGDWGNAPSMTQSGTSNVYYITVPIVTNGKIIFKDDTNQYPSSGQEGVDIIVNGFYNTSGNFNTIAKIGANGYTTFASNRALDLDKISGATPYYVEEVPGSTYVKLKEATGKVSAGTGLVLYGTANADVTIPVVETSAASALSGNILQGCTSEVTITKETANYDKVYVLVNVESKVQFQNVKNWLDSYKSGSTTEYNTLSVPAGKAYLLALSSNAPTLSIDFANETTSIMDAHRGTINNNEYYTLDGRRVAQPTKGLYIVNGKKVIVK